MDPGAELGLSTELSVDRVREPGDRGQREHGLGAETSWSFVDDDETRSGQVRLNVKILLMITCIFHIERMRKMVHALYQIVL